MKRILLLGLMIAILIGMNTGPQSQSLSVLTVERMGDRLLSSEEFSAILQAAEHLNLAVDIQYQTQLYGVATKGHYQAIIDQDGVIYYYSRDPIRLIAATDTEWLIHKTTAGHAQLISYQLATNQEVVLADIPGEHLGDGIVWGNDVYIESSSLQKGHLIYRYQTRTRTLGIFVENGYEPRLYRDRLHYLYEKGDQLGFESINRYGNDLQSFAPAIGDIYSYFFRGEEIDLLSVADQVDGRCFVRIENALGESRAERFDYFDARFQSDRLIFGHNGYHDSLILNDTLIQIPKELHFRRLMNQLVYFVYQEEHYRIPLASLEAILDSK